ncbi:MAG TPA: hypothetical protein V6C97_21600 [Oculatellaceae cyanobacterium]
MLVLVSDSLLLVCFPLFGMDTHALRGTFDGLEERILKAMEDLENKHGFFIINVCGGPYIDYEDFRSQLPAAEVVFTYGIDGVHVTMHLEDNRPPHISWRDSDDPFTPMPPRSELRKTPAMILCDQILRGDARNWQGNVPRGTCGYNGFVYD